jgi:mannose-1-phosphate guanylyltransferase/mannose-6-phosphate isomerase
MFVVRASVWLAALEAFRPDIAAATAAAWARARTDARFVRPGKAEFAAVPSESIDYAVMERCPGSAFDIRMVPWLQAGTTSVRWDAVWQVASKDPGQCVERRRPGAGQQQYPGARHQPPGRRGRRARS